MSRERLPRGIVHVYTGDGKGKTTAALGLATRAVGAGLSVAFLQFIKGGITTSELAVVARLAPRLWIARFADEVTPFSLGQGEPTPQDQAAVAQGWEVARKVLACGAWDLVVLDEICNVCRAGLLRAEDVVAAIESRPGHVEVVCTGRSAPPELLAIADLITEMRCLKHPYDLGLVARRGIEF
ncbi:MAG: cob(I)yrinic acid a,c-diamide adenosyltransferase [Armatimonadetes bacterium]|nr:cob(I)yrinic acid a,c-diamide adenosyltransferase [Armatimonadota bacterium]